MERLVFFFFFVNGRWIFSRFFSHFLSIYLCFDLKSVFHNQQNFTFKRMHRSPVYKSAMRPIWKRATNTDKNIFFFHTLNPKNYLRNVKRMCKCLTDHLLSSFVYYVSQLYQALYMILWRWRVLLAKFSKCRLKKKNLSNPSSIGSVHHC